MSPVVVCVADHIRGVAIRLGSLTIDTVRCGSVLLVNALWCANPAEEGHRQ